MGSSDINAIECSQINIVSISATALLWTLNHNVFMIYKLWVVWVWISKVTMWPYRPHRSLHVREWEQTAVSVLTLQSLFTRWCRGESRPQCSARLLPATARYPAAGVVSFDSRPRQLHTRTTIRPARDWHQIFQLNLLYIFVKSWWLWLMFRLSNMFVIQ